jgi:ribosomal protein L16 Arg81 hydroxylase
MKPTVIDKNIEQEIAAILAFFKDACAQVGTPFVRRVGLLQQPAIFSLEKLQQLINNPLLGPDWIQLTVGGKLLEFDGNMLWKTVQKGKLPFMDKQFLNQALGSGAAIVLEGLDILDFGINSLVQQIDHALPCALSNCEAFFSQRGNEAYGGHRDTDDVLVLQIAGEKRWRVHQPQQRRFIGNGSLTEAQMGPLLSEFVMQAGDVMFLRAGVPHRCITAADHSLHLSFDLCDRTPNIEQITHAANLNYNQASARPNAPAREVLDHYIGQLQSDSFTRELQEATATLRSQAQEFRTRIGRTSVVDALNKFVRN